MDPMNTTNREIRTRKEALAALKEVASGPYAAKRTRLEACLAGLTYLIGIGLLPLLFALGRK